jgi:hypothetical protein
VEWQCKTVFSLYQNLGEVISRADEGCKPGHEAVLQGNKAYGSSVYYDDFRVLGQSGSFSDNFGNANHTQGTTQPLQKLWISGLAKGERVLAEISYSANYSYRINTYRADNGWAYSRHRFTVYAYNEGSSISDSGWVQHRFVGYDWARYGYRVGHWSETGKSRHVSVPAAQTKPHWAEAFKNFETAPPLHENALMRPMVELDVCKIDGSPADLSTGARELFKERLTKEWEEWDKKYPHLQKTPVGSSIREGQFVRPEDVENLYRQVSSFAGVTFAVYSAYSADLYSRGLRACSNLVLQNWRKGTIPILLSNGALRLDLLSGSSTQEAGAYIDMKSSTFFQGIRVLDPLLPGSALKLERPPLLP